MNAEKDAMVAGVTALEPSARLVDLEERLGAFVASHRGRARRLAWGLTGGDEDIAEDVAQDAFIKAYKALSRFREDSSLETWFYRLLVNQAHKHRRWRLVRERRSAAWGEAQAVLSSGAGDPELRRRISQALAKLTRRQREAFILVRFEGFTVRETGNLLRTPEGAVKSHLHRALKALRRELADLQDSDLKEPAMKRDNERPLLDQDDKGFVDRLAAHYAPPSSTPAKRVAFDEALRARIERPQRCRLLVPALATAAVATLVWVTFPPSVGPLRQGGDESNPVVASVWEDELFLSSDVSPLDDRDDSEVLPDDYLAIASLFLGG